ncbi:MAG: MmgE/PrpD family protein [Gemmatimonadetes bacterium]|nr:MmgE/PrpD family protein [Gemmatimonadota bacterium]
MAQDNLSRSLVQLIRSHPVSQDDLRAAERFVRDWLGSLTAGGATRPGAILRTYAQRREDVEGRTFLAAALSHITETDDLHRTSVSHPGCVVVPTALLLGDSLGARGRQVLRAVLAGYEAMIRVGEALGPAHYQIFHNTATAGVFGSAAAAASLLELEEEAWLWALGNAGTQASGLWQFLADSAMSKHLHAGHAAEAGLRAALLAREGFTGATAILEGEQGFFRGFCPDPRPEAVLKPAHGWKLPEASLKPYPSCRHTHPAIDAALELRAGLASRPNFPDAIAAIRIFSYPAAIRLNDKPAPGSRYAAQFSFQFCVATALARGRPTPASFEESRLRDPELVRLMERTTVEENAELAAAYPERWGCEIEVETGDGARHRARQTSPTGDPENPLTDVDLDEKVRGLCAAGGLEPTETEALLEACKALPEDGPPFALPWVTAGVMSSALAAR